MVSASNEPIASRAEGVGDLNIQAARAVTNPPNPNASLDRYLTSTADGTTVFNAHGLAFCSARQSGLGHGSLV